MLKVDKTQQGPVTTFTLSGAINEKADFVASFGFDLKQMVINTKGVNRINSAGVKAWVHYFETAKNRGVTFRFVECSPAIVEQMNLVYNFSCGAPIDSIYLPYLCVKCHFEALALYKTEQLRKMNGQIPDQKCPKCGDVAKFDDIASEYFIFLGRP